MTFVTGYQMISEQIYHKILCNTMVLPLTVQTMIEYGQEMPQSQTAGQLKAP